MAAGAPKYTSQMAVRIGSPGQVELPARVFCGRMLGFLFDPDKCFVLPGALSAIRELRAFHDDHPGLEVVVSGHADRAGDADHNRALSCERAEAVRALLLDEVDAWLPWYDAARPAAKRWGTLEDQHMLAHLGHYTGPVTGRSDRATDDAITAFRLSAGLGAGAADPAMRRRLVERYLASAGTSLPAGTRVVCHGCGEAHPAVATADGVAADANRRVEVFLFEGPIEPPAPERCPTGGCRAYAAWCDRVVETIELAVARQLVEVTVALRDRAAALIARAPYRIQAGDRTQAGRASDGQVTLRAPVSAERCLVEWGREADPDLRDGEPAAFRIELYLHYDLGTDEDQARMRLHNLGYLDTSPLDQALRAFQLDHQLPDTGALDRETRQRLIDLHGVLATPVAPPERADG